MDSDSAGLPLRSLSRQWWWIVATDADNVTWHGKHKTKVYPFASYYNDMAFEIFWRQFRLWQIQSPLRKHQEIIHLLCFADAKVWISSSEYLVSAYICGDSAIFIASLAKSINQFFKMNTELPRLIDIQWFVNVYFRL